MQHGLRKFCKLKVSISQEKVNFVACTLWFCSLWNCLSAWCGCLPIAITSLFQLWFVHRLKRWTPDFTSFETKYSIHKMDSRSARFVSNSCCPLEFLHVRFLYLFFLLAFLICFWKRTTKLQSLDSSCKWASICFVMDYIELSLILDCFGDKKAIKNTKT